MTTSAVDATPAPDRVERYACMSCSRVGPAADMHSHAAEGACRNFRTTTIRVSPSGEHLDERVEVRQLSDAEVRFRGRSTGREPKRPTVRGDGPC